MNGDLPADNHTYDRADTDLLDAFLRKVSGTTDHQKPHLEPAILVKLHDDYMRAQNVYVTWIRASYGERSLVASRHLRFEIEIWISHWLQTALR